MSICGALRDVGAFALMGAALTGFFWGSIRAYERLTRAD
jgi:hypothetical protein